MFCCNSRKKNRRPKQPKQPKQPKHTPVELQNHVVFKHLYCPYHYTTGGVPGSEHVYGCRYCNNMLLCEPAKLIASSRVDFQSPKSTPHKCCVTNMSQPNKCEVHGCLQKYPTTTTTTTTNLRDYVREQLTKQKK